MDDNMRRALEQARDAGATKAIENLPSREISEGELGTGEASIPVNTPGYNPGYTGNWNPAPEAAATPEVSPEVTPEPEPEPPAPEMDGPG